MLAITAIPIDSPRFSLTIKNKYVKPAYKILNKGEEPARMKGLSRGRPINNLP
jgi:hypothetical protein